LSASAYLEKVLKLDSQAIMSIQLLVSGKKDIDLLPKTKKDHEQQPVAYSFGVSTK
jgi:hypothetical protein